MKGLKNYICFAIVILSALAFVLTSCGGGGGSSTVGGGGASLTAANAPQAASAAAQSIQLVQSDIFISIFDLSGNVGPASISSRTSKSFSKSLLKKILDKTMSISKTRIDKSEIHTAAVGSMPTTTVDCFDSGTVTITNAKWTVDPADEFNLKDLSANITANACKEEPYLWNGSMSIAVGGSILEPQKITTVSTPGFDTTDLDTSEKFTMTNLTTVIDYNTEFTIVAMTFTGTISGKINGNPIDFECKNYKINIIDESTVSLSGEIKPKCLGGWVTVKTNTPILQDVDCPTAGEIIITSGANSVKVVIAADSKISVYYNNTPVTGSPYPSCQDIIGLCGV